MTWQPIISKEADDMEDDTPKYLNKEQWMIFNMYSTKVFWILDICLIYSKKKATLLNVLNLL